MQIKYRRMLAFAGVAFIASSASAQDAEPVAEPAPGRIPSEVPHAPLRPPPGTQTQSIEPFVATQAPTSEAAVAPVEASAGYKKGFLVKSADGLFDLRIQQRVQTRYALELVDGDDNKSAILIARARLTLSGHAFTKGLSYKFQTDFGKGFVTLKDFYGDYQVLPGKLTLRVGQFKRPFSRQQINSSGSLELVDRAITDKFFGGGRDIGVALHNDYEHSPTFEYALGIFNGSGDKSRFSGDVTVDPVTGEGELSGGGFSNLPDRMHPALVARVGHNYGGIKGYSEADLEGGPLRFAIAASAIIDLDGDKDDASGICSQADYALKVDGFSSTGGVYVASAQSGMSFSDQSYAALGFHLQAGYMIGGRYQPALRYALIAPDGPDNDRQEVLGGMSIYFFNHGLKWQSEAGALLTDTAGNSKSDYLVRTQLQLSF